MVSVLFHQGMLRSVRRGQDFTVMRSPRIGSGRISQRCVLRVSTVAKYSPNAFPGTHPWQDFRLMYAKRSLGRKNTPSVAIYRRYVSKISWFWQDLRAAYLKSPANRCLGIHIVKILPGRAPFPVRGLQIIHSKLILPSRFPNQRKSPAPDRLHLQSPEQSALPPTSYLHKQKRRPRRVAFQFWHRSEKPTEGNRG